MVSRSLTKLSVPYAKAACLKPFVARRASAIGPEITLPTPIVNSRIEIIVGGDEISFLAMTVIILGHKEGKLHEPPDLAGVLFSLHGNTEHALLTLNQRIRKLSHKRPVILYSC